MIMRPPQPREPSPSAGRTPQQFREEGPGSARRPRLPRQRRRSGTSLDPDAMTDEQLDAAVVDDVAIIGVERAAAPDFVIATPGCVLAEFKRTARSAGPRPHRSTPS